MPYRFTEADRGLIVIALRNLGGPDADALVGRMMAEHATKRTPARRSTPKPPTLTPKARERAEREWNGYAESLKGDSTARENAAETLRDVVALHRGIRPADVEMVRARG